MVQKQNNRMRIGPRSVNKNIRDSICRRVQISIRKYFRVCINSDEIFILVNLYNEDIRNCLVQIHKTIGEQR